MTPVIIRERFFDFLDGGALIGTQLKPEIERLGFQCLLRGVAVGIQLCLQAVRRKPVHKCAAAVRVLAGVAKPYAAFSFDLPQIGATVG